MVENNAWLANHACDVVEASGRTLVLDEMSTLPYAFVKAGGGFCPSASTLSDPKPSCFDSKT